MTNQDTTSIDKQLDVLIKLFEAGKELRAMYEKYDGDLDWTDWLKEVLPKTAINGENGVLNILEDYISDQVAKARIEEVDNTRFIYPGNRKEPKIVENYRVNRIATLNGVKNK